MNSYALLDQSEEDSFHKSRLLNVEEKPFKRITKRLFAPTSLTAVPPTLPPTPPPDASAADEAAAAHEAEKQQQFESHRQWREDTLLDFAAFESSIVRIQFLLTSNIKERERYAAEKLKIQATAQTVRENTAELRVQLEEAQKTLALRKEYDALAEKITSNRLLRPRAEQHANLEKLNEEIAELRRESEEYAQTWAERREQFGKIIEEGMQLRRLIRDEKEEVERREGMGMEEGDDGDTGSHRGRSSGRATPRPETGDATPLHQVQDQDQDMDSPEGTLQVAKQHDSREKSPLSSQHVVTNNERPRVPEIEIEDANMKEEGEVSAGPDKTAAPFEGLMAESDKEEGEEDEAEQKEEEVAAEEPPKLDEMDVS
ncbi:MAG: hypothetical protein LQ343_002998 [Gyalolechia ehrenbergii]|nr:MAG: hypothetical protein LQ343_002998 [Gyalolechia ehrenbergii]